MSHPGLTYADAEIVRLRAENARLRRKLGERGRFRQRLQRAYDDAVLLVRWRAAGLPTSRRWAMRHGLSQRSWQNAVALLRLAGVMEGNRWAYRDPALVDRLLRAAVEYAESRPEAYYANGPRAMTQ